MTKTNNKVENATATTATPANVAPLMVAENPNIKTIPAFNIKYDISSECKVSTIVTTVGEWLDTKTVKRLPDCQRSEVFKGQMVSSFAKTACNHWFIPAVTVEVVEENGMQIYEIVDGQQRTGSLREAQAVLTGEALKRFNSCPLYLMIIKRPENLSQGEFFGYLNTNNKPSAIQAAKGLVISEVREIMDAVADPNFIAVLAKVRSTVKGERTTKDTPATLTLERIGNLDDLIAMIAYAIINPRECSTASKNIANKLTAITALVDHTEVIGNAKKQIATVTKVLAHFSKIESAKRLYSKLCKAVSLIPLVIASAKYNAETLIGAVNILFDEDGTVKPQRKLSVSLDSGTNAKVEIDWLDLMVTSRGSDAMSNYKRTFFILAACKKAMVNAKTAEVKPDQSEVEIEETTPETTADTANDMPNDISNM